MNLRKVNQKTLSKRLEEKYELIVVSGVNGALGHALISLLKSICNHTKIVGLTSKLCDLEDKRSAKNYIQGVIKEVDPRKVAFVHLAALSGGAKLAESYPADIFTSNLRMAMNVLEICQEVGISRVLLTLSTASYSTENVSFDELSLHSNALNSKDFAYGYAKRMQEVLMRCYVLQHKMQVSAILVNGIIGPRLAIGGVKETLPGFLIRSISKMSKSDEVIHFEYDARMRRQYTCSYDLALTALWSVVYQAENTLLNIGNIRNYSFEELSQIIAKTWSVPSSRIQLREKIQDSALVQQFDNSAFVKLTEFEFTDVANCFNCVRKYLEDKSSCVQIQCVVPENSYRSGKDV